MADDWADPHYCFKWNCFQDVKRRVKLQKLPLTLMVKNILARLFLFFVWCTCKIMFAQLLQEHDIYQKSNLLLWRARRVGLVMHTMSMNNQKITKTRALVRTGDQIKSFGDDARRTLDVGRYIFPPEKVEVEPFFPMATLIIRAQTQVITTERTHRQPNCCVNSCHH